MNGTILIYGATGYTGKLIAKAAADAGARPILAGRNLVKVDAVASLLNTHADLTEEMTKVSVSAARELITA